MLPSRIGYALVIEQCKYNCFACLLPMTVTGPPERSWHMICEGPNELYGLAGEGDAFAPDLIAPNRSRGGAWT